MIDSGKIILQRQHENFDAGFGIVHENFPSLVKDLSFLHPAEKAYFEGLRVDKRKQSYLLGRMAAKTAISGLIGNLPYDSMAIDFGVFQFPVVKCPALRNMQVSISHCGDVGVALAFPEEHPLGIDIECLDLQTAEVMATLVCPKEYELIADCFLPLPVGYTLIWTIKEALSKIFRTGLTLGCDLMEIKTMERTGRTFLSQFRHFPQYKAVSFHSNNYICSIILPAKSTIMADPTIDAYLHCLDRQAT